MTVTRCTLSQKSNPRRNGAVIVELALLLPLFLILLLAIVEFGRALSAGQMLVNIAREGARVAITPGATEQAVRSRVELLLKRTAGIPPDSAVVTIEVENAASLSTAPSGALCTVTVEVPFAAVSYLTPSFLDSTVLHGQCTMRHE